MAYAGTSPTNGTLGITTAENNLGEPQNQSSWAGDLGDSFMGHAAYIPGGQFGGNQATDAYAGQASQLGAQQMAYDQGQGQAGQQLMQNQANSMYGNFASLAAGYGQQAAPTVNMGNANAALGAQNQALAQYQQAAAGNGPSAAQAQLQSGLDQSLAAQQAGAASTRGGFGLAGAQHQAAMNAGQLQGQAANNAVQLRAQEQQAGMAGAAGLSTQVQGQQAANAQYAANLQQQQQQMNVQNQLGAYTQAANQNLAYQQAAQAAAQNWQNLGQNTALQYNQLGQQALTSQLSADTASQQTTQQAAEANAKNQQSGVGGIMDMLGSFF